MKLTSRPGRILGKVYVCVVLASAAVWVTYAQQKENSNFTGTVTTLDTPKARMSHYRFEAGARTKWHSHQQDQVIIVDEGVARHQLKGGPVQELHAGDVAYAPAGVPHWHGAAPDQSAVLFSVARGGVTWMDEVSEKDYTAKPKGK